MKIVAALALLFLALTLLKILFLTPVGLSILAIVLIVGVIHRSQGGN